MIPEQQQHSALPSAAHATATNSLPGTGSRLVSGPSLRMIQWRSVSGLLARQVPAVLVLVAALAWAGLFAHLAVLRHLSGGTQAQDLGFTDQVIWNSTQGSWFRMSLYVGAAEWNTEMAVEPLAQPESLLAFHFEPMLALLTPIYALGGDARHLLVLQSLIFALGAIPAYRLGTRWTHSAWVGAAVAGAYLLSPLGQSAMLSDFHTTALAAPLLLLAIERAAAQRTLQALGVGLLASTAREDAALAVAVVGMFILLTGASRAGVALLAVGGIGTGLSMAVIAWHGGGSWAFGPRYAYLQEGPLAAVQAVTRPEVAELAAALLLSGGLLAMLSPLSLIPLLPLAAANALSSSPWMATGRAHYSVLVLPLAIAAAAFAVGRLADLPAPRPKLAVRGAALGLLAGAFAAHLWAGFGPLGANFAPASVTDHARLVDLIAARIPPDAAVSASSPLVPKVSRRPAIYLFPAIVNADYVFVDVTGSAAPTSPGDTFLRLRQLLGAGGWHIDAAEDGVLLLARRPGAPALAPRDLPPRFFSFVRGAPSEPARPDRLAGLLMPAATLTQPLHGGAGFPAANLELVGGEVLLAAADTAGVDGVSGVLRTRWRGTAPVPSGTWLEVHTNLLGGREARVSDIAATWWYPPEQWLQGELIFFDIPIPLRGFTGWSARVHGSEE